MSELFLSSNRRSAEFQSQAGMFWAWRPREAQREKDNILKLTTQYEVAATCNKDDGEQNKQEKKRWVLLLVWF